MAARRFAGIIEQHGGKYHPFRMGILVSVYVAETDEQARAEMQRSAASSWATPKPGKSSTPAARLSPAVPRLCARSCGR
jgi:alkanesulfonate monooxygenase SsuD/methylene tetrahydromethanopterin reductase-like flavin-dependent oxidoreductase (luciferase family)